jgi:hypothetical protein
MQITPQFAAISFVILVVLANWAIHRTGDWLYPDPIALDSESPQSDRWEQGSNFRITSTNLEEAI